MSRVFRQVMTGLVSIVRRASELLLTASGEEKASVRGFAGRGGRRGASSRSASRSGCAPRSVTTRAGGAAACLHSPIWRSQPLLDFYTFSEINM